MTIPRKDLHFELPFSYLLALLLGFLLRQRSRGKINYTYYYVYFAELRIGKHVKNMYISHLNKILSVSNE